MSNFVYISSVPFLNSALPNKHTKKFPQIKTFLKLKSKPNSTSVMSNIDLNFWCHYILGKVKEKVAENSKQHDQKPANEKANSPSCSVFLLCRYHICFLTFCYPIIRSCEDQSMAKLFLIGVRLSKLLSARSICRSRGFL